MGKWKMVKWEEGKMENQENGKMVKWEEGKMGKRENGKTGKQENGKIGIWEKGKVEKGKMGKGGGVHGGCWWSSKVAHSPQKSLKLTGST